MLNPSYRYDAQVLQPLKIPAIVGKQCEVMAQSGRANKNVQIADEVSSGSQAAPFTGEYPADGFV